MSLPAVEPGRSRWTGPLIVLALSLGLTAAGWQMARRYSEEEARLTFESDAERLEMHIAARMMGYEQIARGGKAFFLASEEVTRDEWRAYVAALRLEEHHPGIQGVGYAEVIPTGGVPAHEARVRAEGHPNYTVHPPGDREIMTAIVYLEPFEGRNLRAFGFDMYSEPVRREAMARARDEGGPALSGKVRLVQENETDVQPGILLYVPLYAGGVSDPGTIQERRASLIGWVYSPFRTRDLIEGILSERRPSVQFRVYDGQQVDPEALLYDSDPGVPLEREGPAWQQRTSTLLFAGRPWTVVTAPPVGAAASSASLLPPAVLAGGIVTSALLSGIALSLNVTRERALRIAEGMTTELRESKRKLEISNEALRAFSYVVSHDLKEPVRGVEAYLRILREDHEAEMDGEAASLVGKAHESTLRLSALLQSLLELSSVDRGSLQRQPLRIEEVLGSEACRLAFETLQAERGARVDVEPAPPALGSVSVLAQALGNLVANAIRYNGAPAPRVLVHGGARADGFVEWIVEDDGAGFPPGFAEAFNAGEPQPRGFGLLIAQRAVERLGGRLRLGRGERLGGAAAILRLPAAPTRPPGEA